MTGRLFAGLLFVTGTTGPLTAQPPKSSAPADTTRARQLLLEENLGQRPDFELRVWEWRLLRNRLDSLPPGSFLAFSPDGEPKLPDAVAFDKLVVDALRDVHNRGADLYNTAREFDSAYRMYEGGLVAVRPLLGHRPAAQKLIDEGFAAAEKEPTAARRAFKLHETIEAVRKHLKEIAAPVAPVEPKVPVEVAPQPKGVVPPKKPDDDKKPEDTKKPVEVKKPDEVKKPKEPAPVAKATGPTGVLTFQGKPLPGTDVILVSVTLAKPRVFVATTKDDGTYAFADALPAGKYVVVVQGNAVAVPAKYQSANTSSLVVEVKTGAETFDFALQ